MMIWTAVITKSLQENHKAEKKLLQAWWLQMLRITCVNCAFFIIVPFLPEEMKQAA